MKKAKFTSLILAFLLTVSFAVSCSDNSDISSSDTASADTTSASDSTETSTAAPEYIAPDVDYDGAECLIAAYAHTVPSLELDKYNDVAVEEMNGDILNDAIFERNRQVEEDLNVKVKLYEVNSRTGDHPALKVILSGEDMFSAMSVNFNQMPQFLNEKGLTIDLKSIPTFDYDASWWSQKSIDAFTLLDSLYCITGDFNLYCQMAPVGVLFNADMAADFGFDSFYDSVRDGTWTLDKLFGYCDKVAGDVDGDGKMDFHYDRFGMTSEAKTTEYLLRSGGIRMTQNNSEGVPELTLVSEKTATMVEKIIPFLRNNDVNIYDEDVKNTDYIGSIATMSDNRLMFLLGQIYMAMQMRAYDTDYGILPLPKYDEAQDEYISSTNASFSTFVVVPATNGKLEMTGDLLNSLGYHSKEKVTPAFIETTILHKSLRNVDSEEMLNIILDTCDFDIASAYNWGTLQTTLSTMTSRQNVNLVSTYEAIEQQINTEIEATIEALK